jgi:phage terminase large subunit-like protein
MDKSKEQIVITLKENLGNISSTCELIGISRGTFYNWYNSDSEFKTAIDEVQEIVIDHVENKLLERIDGVEVLTKDRKGEDKIYKLPPDPTSIIFYLKTKGKKRGFSEKPELENNSSIEQTPNFINFLKAFNRNYQVYNHIDFIRERLKQNIKDGVNTCLSIPPQHGKTTTVLAVLGDILINNPGIKTAYVSYSQRFSESRTKELRNALEEFGYRSDVWNSNNLILKNGSKLITTSIGGALTGEQIDLLIIDDAIKDMQEAFSSVTKEKIWNWFESVAETRMPSKGVIVVIGTRWHSNDLIGKIKQNRNYDLIELKALSTENDILGRKENEALFPERYNNEYLFKLKEEKPQIFDLLYQGNDKALSDTVFNDVNFYSELPKTELVYSIGADLSYTNNKESDFTAVVITAYDINQNMRYVTEAMRWKGDISETVVRLGLIQKQYSTPISMEYNGTQIGIVDMLEREGLKINKIKINQSKLVRALPVSQLWNNKTLLVNPNINEEFIGEVCNFTGTAADAHDDFVDALVYSNNLRVI